jgi:hypothetical protein
MKRRFVFFFLGLAVVGILGASVKQLQASAPPICSDYVCIALDDECHVPEITCKSCYNHRCKEN